MRNKSGEFLGRHQRIAPLIPEIQIRWVVVANRTQAVIYRENTSGYKFIQKLQNPDGRRSERELDSDKPGRGSSNYRLGTVRHALDRHFDQQEEVARKFAIKIVDALKKARSEERFTELVFVAEPHFLGLLRNHLPLSLHKLIKEEIQRELQRVSAKSLSQWKKKRDRKEKLQ